MSNHRKISLKDVYDMLPVIKQCLQEVRSGSKFALSLIIVLLYEYCLCYAFFQIHPGDKRTNKPLNHKDLKSFLKAEVNEDLSCCVNEFFSIRNQIAHCDPDAYNTNDILYLLTDKYFESILQKCEVPNDIIVSVLMFYNIYPVNDPKDAVYSLTKSTIPADEIALCVTYADCINLVNKYK